MAAELQDLTEAATPQDLSAAAAPLVEIDGDDATLRDLGLVRELDRSLDVYANFGLSYSVICIVAGGISSFSAGFTTLGGAAIGLGWPAGCLISLLVALALAQIASAFPTAGSLYHWSRILAGPGWGWATGWLNIAGLVFVTAAINVGAYQFLLGVLRGWSDLDISHWGVWHQLAAVVLLTGSQAVLNQIGIRLVGRLAVANIYVISLAALGLGLMLLVFAPNPEIGRLFRFENFSGPAGAGTWPQQSGMAQLFLLALLLPGYTITGFDISAHAAEETVRAAHEVPRALLVSVAVSAVFGYYMVAAFVLAMPDTAQAAAQGGNLFFWLVGTILPQQVGLPLLLMILIANYVCGLAAVTSTSRMLYAMARGGDAPFGRQLSRVSPTRRTPGPAIWTVAILSVLATTDTPTYTVLAAASVILLYLSYGMPIAAALIAWRRHWTGFGPFNLGRWFPACSVAAMLGIALLVYAGIQPPNDGAIVVVLGLVLLLTLGWAARRAVGRRWRRQKEA